MPPPGLGVPGALHESPLHGQDELLELLVELLVLLEVGPPPGGVLPPPPDPSPPPGPPETGLLLELVELLEPDCIGSSSSKGSGP